MSALQPGKPPVIPPHPELYPPLPATPPWPRSLRDQTLPERLFRASKASSSKGITMLSNRPRSVGATTLLPEQRGDRLWQALGWSVIRAEAPT